ncbi:MAG TPA: polyphosphate kinase 2 family protein [Roseiflexaceae bacterium]|nr:polyphosphate kinase 2 family protein [Roseiflexaceae bacterium]
MPYAFKVAPGKSVRLADYDADADSGMNKEAAQEKLAKLTAELGRMQEELYAAGEHSLLMILQGMDTSGKDGTIRGVLVDVNPLGCRVESFKVPTEEELAHDFLWRAHRVTPRKGMIGVFNRSHYEDVLVVRVHSLVPDKVWKARYDQINDFERMLATNNTIVVKFFLHITKQEQEQRLLEREQDVSKAWKLSAGDWRERERWDDYIEAYQDVLSRCSSEVAPWHIVPANRKWYRNLAVCEALVDTLASYQKGWRKSLDAMAQARLAELAEMRAGKTNDG